LRQWEKQLLKRLWQRLSEKSEVSPGEYVQFSASNIDHPFILTGTDMSERFGKWKSQDWTLFDPGKIIFAPEHCGSYTRSVLLRLTVKTTAATVTG